MASDPRTISWSADHDILLNPRWSQSDQQKLMEIAKCGLQRGECHQRKFVALATSGSSAETTQQTKLVFISKEALLISAAAVNAHLQSDYTDTWAKALPLFHVGGLGISARAFLTGAKIIDTPNLTWDAKNFAKLCHTENITLTALVPTQIFDLVTHNLSAPKSLRAVIVGGGALSEDLFKKATALGWNLLPSYGMTETGSQVATANIKNTALLDFNLPPKIILPHVEIKINQDKLIQIKSPALFSFYGVSDSTKASFWNPIQNGWFTTEDQGQCDKNQIEIIGRQNNFFKVGGENTSLTRLLEIFEKNVAQIAPQLKTKLTLLNIQSDRLDNAVYLIHSEPIEDCIIKIHNQFNAEVLPFEKIRGYINIPVIPRSPLGKILTGQLRKALAERKLS